MPRVSVLLTCYNHIAYLPAALESVRAQTYQDFEIIAIDDVSTDGTREWLSDNAGSARVLLNETNLGTYETLNRALTHASGEFIAILNDDDLWHTEKLRRQIDLLEAHPQVGCVHTDGQFINGASTIISGSPLGFEFPRFKTGSLLIPLLYQNKIIASAALVRRKCFDVVGTFNSDYFGSGDWEMWLRIAERFQFGFVPEKLTNYRVHGENASHKLERIWKDDERLREWIRTRYGVYKSMELDQQQLRAAIAHNEACLGTIYTLNGRPALGRRAYAQSIKLLPTRFKSYVRYIATFLPQRHFRSTIHH